MVKKMFIEIRLCNLMTYVIDRACQIRENIHGEV